MQEKVRGSLEMTAAMMISGTIGVFVVLSGQSVADVVFWRCLIGAATLLIVCWALGFLRWDALTRWQALLAIIGGVAIVTNWLFLFAAYSRASISIATAVYNTQPFMLVGLGALFFGERLTAVKLGWLSIAFVGMLALVSAKAGASYSGTAYATGIVLALAAAFCYAVAAIVTKKLKGVPPHLIALIHVSVGAVMLAPFAGVGTRAIDGFGWTMLATIGIVHTGLMYILLYGAIQKLPTHFTGALSFIYPIVAILGDMIVFGHRLQPLQIVGSAMILLAAAGMTLGWTFRRTPAGLVENVQR